MIILGIEFLALIVICYVFLVFATKERNTGKEAKPIPNWAVAVIIMIPLALILFMSWYIRLGLAS
ncbi:MAG: hypothetical protein QGG54_02930 [Gammaproteobacteria bacterium]|jgi:hydrogenase-4 membrane subunit HyfE|nr:hypothetical protein [Chromatiales bacterium]MDP6413977.1 hypothetical protein [Gammaproteobacteria bacterium]